MERDRLLGQIDAARSRNLDRLVELASIPSISATGQGIRECADALLAIMGSLGIETELLETGGAPLIRGRIGRGAPRIVIYGHYDVQPAGPEDLWQDPPFQPVVRDEAVWGRGVGDNKGQLLAHLCALDAWVETYGEPPPFELVFVFDGEEEIGSPASQIFIRNHADEFRGDFLYGADGSTLGQPDPAVYLGVRGLLYIELVASGPTHEWHSGSYGGLLPNAIHRLAGALMSLAEVDGTPKIPGLLEGVASPTESQRRLSADLPQSFLANAEAFEADAFRVADPRDAMFFTPQFCICGVSGGYGGPGVKTAVPTDAIAKIDLTLVPDQDPEQVTEHIRAHLDRSGFDDIDLRVLASCPPISTPVEDPFVQKAIEALSNVWERPPTVFPSIGGGGPLAAFVGGTGMPCLMVPYAQADLNEHSVHEHLALDWFHNGIKTSAELFRLIATSDHPSQ